MLISLNYNFRENHHNAIFTPAVIEDKDIIKNTGNTTTSHLNDNLVSLCYFVCVCVCVCDCAELGQQCGSNEIRHLNDKARSRYENAAAPFRFVKSLSSASDLIYEGAAGALCSTVCRCTNSVTNGCGPRDYKAQ